MIPGIHYSEDEKYSRAERRTKCPHCGYEHKADIGFYKACLNCRKYMGIDKKEITKGRYDSY